MHLKQIVQLLTKNNFIGLWKYIDLSYFAVKNKILIASYQFLYPKHCFGRYHYICICNRCFWYKATSNDWLVSPEVFSLVGYTRDNVKIYEKMNLQNMQVNEWERDKRTTKSRLGKLDLI